MLWVGLTGGIATGKSTVSQILRELKVPVIDADDLAKQVVTPGSQALADVANVFGQEVLDERGGINRQILAKEVFNNPEQLAKLEGIIHPHVRALCEQKRQQLEASGCRVAFYDVPLLYEKKLEETFDFVVVVYCNESMQKQRALARGMTEDDFIKRKQAQMPLAEKMRLADFTLENNGDLADLRRQVVQFLQRLS